MIDGVQSACGAILRGCGRPKPGTICNLVGHYVFGIPIGVSLAFATKLKIYGFWVGLLCGTIIVTVSLVTMLVRLDWVQVAMEAKQRTQKETSLYELDEYKGEKMEEREAKDNEPEFTTADKTSESENLLEGGNG